MRVQIALRTANGAIIYKIIDGVQAMINPQETLQIFSVYNKQLVAEYPRQSYASWQNVGSPLRATPRATALLQNNQGGTDLPAEHTKKPIIW